MNDGGGLSLEDTWHGMGLVECYLEWCKECFWCVSWSFSSSLLTWVFGFLLGVKNYFWAGGGCLDIAVFSSFIAVCCDPWSSRFWLDRLFNFWIMVFPPWGQVDNTSWRNKILPQAKLVKEIGFMVKVWSTRVSIRIFEVCRSLVFIPPNGCDTLEPQTSISLFRNNPPASKPNPP